MKKKSGFINKAIVLFIVILVALFVSIYYKADNVAAWSDSDSNFGSDSIVSTQAIEGMQIYFCPEDCGDMNKLFPDDLNKMLCAIYDIEYDWFWDKARKLFDLNKEVIIVSDNDQFYANYTKLDPVVLDDINYLNSKGLIKLDTGSGYMHSKICVLDDYLLIGSKNFNKTKNYDNFILIKDKGLTSIAETEIKELYSGNFDKGEKTISQKGAIQLYFCPEDGCEEKYLEELSKAKDRIHCEFFTLTLDSLSTEMLNQKQGGADLKLIFENSQISQYSQFTKLIDYSKKTNGFYLHSKFCIIDDSVITGSMNPSKNSDTKNNEAIIIIHDEKVAEIYEDKFQEHWNKIE